MSPDMYLGFTALFITYVLKVAVACLVCWILSALLNSPRQRFTIWLGFTLGSFIYWLYSLSSFAVSTFSTGGGGAVLHSVSRVPHQFLIPAKFQYAIVVFGRVLAGAYILGVLLLIGIGIWKRIRLRFLLRHGITPSSGLQGLFSAMCRHFGLRHAELLVLAQVNSPATVYWWRPRIVLPQVCEELRESGVVADILSHELAHVARRDYLWSSISDVICGLLFFHPGIWQARKQMRIYREMACDHAVIAARPEHRADYAHTLTRIARLCLPRKFPVIGIDFAAAPSLLRHRVEAILDDSHKSSPAKNFSRALAALALVAGFGFLCSVMAIALAFVASQPARKASATVPPNSITTTASTSAHKIHRAPMQRETQSYIEESPAYRLPSTSASSAYTPGWSSSPAPDADVSSPGGPFPTFPTRRTVPVGRTVESIIVSTVGAVVIGDKDDRNTPTKKK